MSHTSRSKKVTNIEFPGSNIKTTPEDFQSFVAEIQLWVDRLGLHEYDIDIYHADLLSRGEQARIETWESQKRADFYYSTKLPPGVTPNPKFSARHEVFHLLLSRMVWLATMYGSHKVDFKLIDTEWERLANVLAYIGGELQP